MSGMVVNEANKTFTIRGKLIDETNRLSGEEIAEIVYSRIVTPGAKPGMK